MASIVFSLLIAYFSILYPLCDPLTFPLETYALLFVLLT